MLAVELNRANFEYDVNSIVRAFYPEDQVYVLTPECREEKWEQLQGSVRIRIGGRGIADRGRKGIPLGLAGG